MGIVFDDLFKGIVEAIGVINHLGKSKAPRTQTPLVKWKVGITLNLLKFSVLHIQKHPASVMTARTRSSNAAHNRVVILIPGPRFLLLERFFFFCFPHLILSIPTLFILIRSVKETGVEELNKLTAEMRGVELPILRDHSNQQKSQGRAGMDIQCGLFLFGDDCSIRVPIP
ncbi:MAG: hypothetical protein A2162_11490 [Deltaproteobacteria bacterium RBG_13_52_11b]|nr:MAG: hypothetical protein A2162_11490 [Deltaproteobacteria bacterium RBG_13_52_11b]